MCLLPTKQAILCQEPNLPVQRLRIRLLSQRAAPGRLQALGDQRPVLFFDADETSHLFPLADEFRCVILFHVFLARSWWDLNPRSGT